MFHCIVSLSCLTCVAAEAYGQAPAITNISVDTNRLSLAWDTPTNAFIVVQTPDLSNWSNASWCAAYSTGAIVDTIGFAISGQTSLYCRLIAGREVVYIPDSTFRAAVIGTLGASKMFPTNEAYKTEVREISSLAVRDMGIASLRGIEEFSSLNQLLGDRNALTHLDVSSNASLSILACYDNSLTNLLLPPSMAYLYCLSNDLVQLDVSSCTDLVWLACWKNGITALDLSAHNKLDWLECYDNALTNLLLPTSTTLWHFDCRGNHLTSLDVSGNVNLEAIVCASNGLTQLDVSANLNLTHLLCQDNGLTGTLDIAANTALLYVDTTSNSLSEIIVWDTNNLPATFLYDGGVTIREP